MNFRDFKGNTLEAMNKLLNDLKKFGSQVARTVKPDSLAKGFGEDVCHLIDELLNIELYRRDYQFFMPIIPRDEADEFTDADDGDGSNEYYGT